MSGASIDRLTLQVPGWSETAARRLAVAVAERLAREDLADLRGDVSTLRVEIPATGGGEPDWLAGQVVAEILRQLQRQP